jgi:hypothetical protein
MTKDMSGPERLYAVIGTVTAERNHLAMQLAAATGRGIEEVLREVSADVNEAFTAADAELASLARASVGSAGQDPVSAAPSPIVLTFVTWDPETDGVAIAHDGEVVWRESTFDSLGQYLRTVAPLGIPVVLRVGVGPVPDLLNVIPEASEAITEGAATR